MFKKKKKLKYIFLSVSHTYTFNPGILINTLIFPLQFWEVCSAANSTSSAVRLSQQMQHEQTNTLKHDPICLFVWALRETHTERGRNEEEIEREKAGRGWERTEIWWIHRQKARTFAKRLIWGRTMQKSRRECGGCMWRDSRSGRSQPVLRPFSLHSLSLCVCLCWQLQYFGPRRRGRQTRLTCRLSLDWPAVMDSGRCWIRPSFRQYASVM